MTTDDPPTHRATAGARILALAAVLACAGCASDASSDPVAPVVESGGSVFDQLDKPKEDEPEEKVRAVTHLGRELLPRVGLIILGRTRSYSQAPGGVELVRFEVTEVLRSVPWDRMPEGPGVEPILTVFCGESGMLPRPGTEAVLLVARRPRSPNHDVVQVVDVTGRDGPERLEALRTYIEIEDIPNEEQRALALREYLRSAVRSPRKWVRSNAAREYGSLARARPQDLDSDDAAVLRTAVFGASEADVRIALQSALSVAERNTRAPHNSLRTGDAGPITELEVQRKRFAEASDPLERRKIVIEAAVELDLKAVPLLREALEDEDPRVRDAAIASAGQLRAKSLGPDLVPLLASDQPLQVRRSVVRSVGYIRESSAVPTLQALARAPGDVGDDSCYALARIRDSAAVAALGNLLRGADGDRRELIEYLLTDAFVEQEAALGRPIE